MESRRTIVLVLRSGGDFSFRDVQLITDHINGKWKSEIRPRIICLWDKATEHYDLGNVELIPLNNEQPGTWARIQTYSPEMEQYRPFLYVDLDTAVINSIENIFDLVEDQSQFIVLEDFWQKGRMATGLVWFPANSEKVKTVWDKFKGSGGSRMDNYLRNVITPDAFWQNLTGSIRDFKPSKNALLEELPSDTNLVCFHGKPRVFNAQAIPWVKQYVEATFPKRIQPAWKVTVIIPYNRDRGFLQDAINSVPKDVQLLLSKGDGYWTQNFNKALKDATGDFIKYLHEDDLLTPNCIEDSVNAIETQGVDFIHGNAIEFYMDRKRKRHFRPYIKIPTVEDLLNKNKIHSATLMYRREVFDKLGGFDERIGRGVSEEYEFNLRCLKAGMKIGYCDSILARYRRHPNQKIKTTNKETKFEERELVKAMYQ